MSPRRVSAGPLAVFLVLAVLPTLLLAQSQDPRVDALEQQTTDLKKTVAEQEQRIAELEKTIKALQAILAPLPKPIPSPTPAWQSASSWNMIKPGMSEAEVVAILGPPSRVQSVTDMRTLYYEPGPKSTTTLAGSVTLMDDRVTASTPPAF